jgi:hypothetical protein
LVDEVLNEAVAFEPEDRIVDDDPVHGGIVVSPLNGILHLESGYLAEVEADAEILAADAGVVGVGTRWCRFAGEEPRQGQRLT